MSSPFDPYRDWLGIESEELADHYRLLGIDTFEPDPDVISLAAKQRIAYVRTFETGEYSAAAQRILDELSLARDCLLDPAEKAEYDDQLWRAEFGDTDEPSPETADDGYDPLEARIEALARLHDDFESREVEARPFIPSPPPPSIADSFSPDQQRQADLHAKWRLLAYGVLAVLLVACIIVAMRWGDEPGTVPDGTEVADQGSPGEPAPVVSEPSLAPMPARLASPAPRKQPGLAAAHKRDARENLVDRNRLSGSNSAAVPTVRAEDNDTSPPQISIGGTHDDLMLVEAEVSQTAIPASWQGNWETEIADLSKRIRTTSLRPEPYVDRGIYYCRQGDYDQALLDFTKAIELGPQLARAYHNRGVAWVLVQDLDLAVADFTEAIRLNPGYAEAYANRGLAYGRMATRYGNMDYREKAAADFRKAQQLGMDVR